MSKLPPIFNNRPSRSRTDRAQDGQRRPRDVKAKHSTNVQPEEAVEGFELPEKEMTEDELHREMEKRAEAQLAHLEASEDLDEAKDARAKEIEKEEAEKEHDGRPVKAGSKSLNDKRPSSPEKLKAKDGFEKEASALQSKQAEKLSPSAPVAQPNPTVPHKPDDPMALLNMAQPPGVYFREDSPHNPVPELQNPELLEAVEEAKRLLVEVTGIERITPGLSQQDEPSVVVVAQKGFGEVSLSQIPPEVRNFPTLLAIPYDLLPLKKDRTPGKP